MWPQRWLGAGWEFVDECVLKRQEQQECFRSNWENKFCLKSIVSDTADIKNRFESVAFTGAQVAE